MRNIQGYMRGTKKRGGYMRGTGGPNPSLNEGYRKKRSGYMRGTGEIEPQSQ